MNHGAYTVIEGEVDQGFYWCGLWNYRRYCRSRGGAGRSRRWPGGGRNRVGSGIGRVRPFTGCGSYCAGYWDLSLVFYFQQVFNGRFLVVL